MAGCNARSRPRPLKDAEADIAAVLFGDRRRPDIVLKAFADELQAAGLRVAGLVQSRASLNGPGRTDAIRLGRPTRIPIPHGAPTTGRCMPPPETFNEVVSDLLATLRRGVDLVVLNRFGRLEATGGGLWPVIAEAHRLKVPLVLAVSRAGYEHWHRWSGGMAV